MWFLVRRIRGSNMAEPLEELLEWHRVHGPDAGRLFSERPDLFRRMVSTPGEFGVPESIREFAEAVVALASAAQYDADYRRVFGREVAARTPREEGSYGLVAEDEGDDE
jgi:hypothetical protein